MVNPKRVQHEEELSDVLIFDIFWEGIVRSDFPLPLSIEENRGGVLGLSRGRGSIRTIPLQYMSNINTSGNSRSRSSCLNLFGLSVQAP